jgi:hypothetical protein
MIGRSEQVLIFWDGGSSKLLLARYMSVCIISKCPNLSSKLEATVKMSLICDCKGSTSTISQ